MKLAAALFLLAALALYLARPRRQVIVATHWPYPPESDDGVDPYDPRTWPLRPADIPSGESHYP